MTSARGRWRFQSLKRDSITFEYSCASPQTRDRVGLNLLPIQHARGYPRLLIAIATRAHPPGSTRSPIPPPTCPATPSPTHSPSRIKLMEATTPTLTDYLVPAEPPELQGSRRVGYRVFSRTLHGKIGRVSGRIAPDSRRSEEGDLTPDER